MRFMCCNSKNALQNASLCSLPLFLLCLKGGALWFDRERADVLGILWRDMPRSAATIEFWVQISDPMNTDHSVLGFSEFDGAGAVPLDNPDGLEIRFSIARARFYRSDPLTCSACRFFQSGWFHWAVTWDASTGIVLQFFFCLLQFFL